MVLDDDGKRDEEYLAVEHGVVDGVPLVLSQGGPVFEGANSCALIEIFFRMLRKKLPRVKNSFLVG